MGGAEARPTDPWVYPQGPLPAGAPAPGAAEVRWPLDTAMGRLTAGRAWGLRPVVVPIVMLVLVIVISQLLARVLHPTSPADRVWASASVNGGAQLLLAGGVWWGGRAVAAANGG